MILSFKPSIKLQKTKSGNLLISFQNKTLQYEFSVNKEIWRFVEWIGENISKNEVLNKISLLPEHSQKEVLQALEFFLKEDIIEELGEDEFHLQNIYLEDAFFSRQTNFLSDYADANHSTSTLIDSIRKSHIAILGIGAIGSWISYSLVQLGVGKLSIIDSDVVELSNLNRQALYDRNDIGKKKAEILAHKLKKINPEVEIDILDCLVYKSTDLDSLKPDLNLIVNCADVPSAFYTSKLVTEFSIKRDIPCINGIGYNGNTGRIGTTTIPKQSLSWMDIYKDQENLYEHREEIIFKKHKPTAGSISPISMFIASLHVMEILKIIIPNWTPSFMNKVGSFKFEDNKIEFDEYEYNTALK